MRAFYAICLVLATPTPDDIQDAITKMDNHLEKHLQEFKDGTLKVDEKTKKETADELQEALDDADTGDNSAPPTVPGADTGDASATPTVPSGHVLSLSMPGDEDYGSSFAQEKTKSKWSSRDIDEAVRKMDHDIDEKMEKFKEGTLTVDPETKKEVAKMLADAAKKQDEADAAAAQMPKAAKEASEDDSLDSVPSASDADPFDSSLVQEASTKKKGPTDDKIREAVNHMQSAVMNEYDKFEAMRGAAKASFVQQPTKTKAQASVAADGSVKLSSLGQAAPTAEDQTTDALTEKIETEASRMKNEVMNEYQRFEALRGQAPASFAEKRDDTTPHQKFSESLKQVEDAFTKDSKKAMNHYFDEKKGALAADFDKFEKSTASPPTIEQEAGTKVADKLFESVASEVGEKNPAKESLLQGDQDNSIRDELETAFQKGYSKGAEEDRNLRSDE